MPFLTHKPFHTEPGATKPPCSMSGDLFEQHFAAARLDWGRALKGVNRCDPSSSSSPIKKTRANQNDENTHPNAQQRRPNDENEHPNSQQRRRPNAWSTTPEKPQCAPSQRPSAAPTPLKSKWVYASVFFVWSEDHLASKVLSCNRGAKFLSSPSASPSSSNHASSSITTSRQAIECHRANGTALVVKFGGGGGASPSSSYTAPSTRCLLQPGRVASVVQEKVVIAGMTGANRCTIRLPVKVLCVYVRACVGVYITSSDIVYVRVYTMCACVYYVCVCILCVYVRACVGVYITSSDIGFCPCAYYVYTMIR